MRTLAFAATAALLLTTAHSAGSVTTDSLVPAAQSDEVSVAGTSAEHPFSDPIWYPLRVEAKVGCGHSNPGCDRPHNFWTQILTPLGQKNNATTSKAKVTAMGAGVAHIGEKNGDKCGSGDASYGTWVWVDHGGGVASRYGHLSEILISDGDRVLPGDDLGVIGTTGKRSSDSCFRAYLDFQVKEHGVRGDDIEFPTLQACDGGKEETWPAGFTSQNRWNDVPATAIAPANDDNCMPNSVPDTTGKPRGVELRSPGKERLRVSWDKASGGVDIVRLELARYRPGNGTWEDMHKSKWKDADGDDTSLTFKKLMSDSRYRVRVHFHTRGEGWSLATSWVKARAK